MMNLAIEKSTAPNGAYVITVDGELDVYTAPRLKEAIAEALAGGHKTLVLDLLKVGFLDSTALGVLVGGLRSVRSEQGELRLVIDDPHVAKIFRITGFDGMFSIYGTLAEAATHAPAQQAD
jgi:anti-sigma B factor antagonist